MAEFILAKCRGIMMKVLVDPEDFSEMSKRRWNVIPAKGGGVCSGVRLCRGKYKTVYLHRMLLNAQPGEYVDHINGNPCDNRKVNLRITTNQQNCENKHGTYSNNTSGYRGVSFDKQHKKYEAYYWKHYKKYNVGYFEDIEDAAAAVTLARRENLPFSEMDKVGAAQIVNQALKENESFFELFQMAA